MKTVFCKIIFPTRQVLGFWHLNLRDEAQGCTHAHVLIEAPPCDLAILGRHPLSLVLLTDKARCFPRVFSFSLRSRPPAPRARPHLDDLIVYVASGDGVVIVGTNSSRLLYIYCDRVRGGDEGRALFGAREKRIDSAKRIDRSDDYRSLTVTLGKAFARSPKQ